jgi:hypothetical protein
MNVTGGLSGPQSWPGNGHEEKTACTRNRSLVFHPIFTSSAEFCDVQCMHLHGVVLRQEENLPNLEYVARVKQKRNS